MSETSLESFMEEYLLSNCCQYVDLGQTALLYRKQTGKKPVMVVDGVNFVHKFYYSSDIERDFLCGGQLKDFTKFAQDFVRICRDLDIEPVFYFNGAAESKLDCQSVRESRMLKRDMLFCNLGNLKPYKWNKWKILPLLVSETASFIFKYECKCAVYISVKDLCKELADYANKESCFAVLSQDTDFLCLKSATYYLSIKYLNLKDMKTLTYNRFGIHKFFAFTVQQMWLFVCLLGNAAVSEQRLRHFHLHICGRNCSLRRKCEMVAKFVRNMTEDCCNNVEQAVPRIVQSLETLRLDVLDEEIRASLQRYKPSAVESWVTDKDIEKSWLEVLEVAYTRHVECEAVPQVYNTLVGQPYKIDVLLEKTTRVYKDSSRFFLPLRQKIYSLLLHQKPWAETPHCVKEFGMWDNSWHDLELVNVPEFKEDIQHPGLIALWTKDTQQIDKQRWALFANTISPRLDPAALNDLNRYYVVPAVLLVYMLDFQKACSLEDVEIDSFIMQAVTVLSLEPEKMDAGRRLKVNSTNERMINLSTLFGYGINMILFLMSVLGFPLEKAMPWNYFDGPLFHYFLMNAKEGQRAIFRLSRYFSLQQVQWHMHGALDGRVHVL
ncbi:constitutive coactivator of peroxisome proliferator-activated receptor gamma isoform X2 [Anabrus simplex]|uniref:constitutive coactivator of peroxisome proliferator-activated receptor gamma isoform X2 n=1 Tax=Anabrus simplex TaxID=316456 RepID=UPI0035A2EE97